MAAIVVFRVCRGGVEYRDFSGRKTTRQLRTAALLDLSPLLAFKPTHVEESISRCLTEAWGGIPAIRALLTQEVRQKRFELAGKRFNNYVRFVRHGLREQPGMMFQKIPGMTAETYKLRMAAEGS